MEFGRGFIARSEAETGDGRLGWVFLFRSLALLVLRLKLLLYLLVLLGSGAGLNGCVVCRFDWGSMSSRRGFGCDEAVT